MRRRAMRATWISACHLRSEGTLGNRTYTHADLVPSGTKNEIQIKKVRFKTAEKLPDEVFYNLTKRGLSAP
jgi:hypothetical protein